MMHVSIYVLIFLVAGMIVGYQFRRQPRLIKIADRCTLWIIYLFLFLLGLGVGVNEKIVQNLGTLGIQAGIITAGALVGSICGSYLLARFILKTNNNEK